jgi:regulator of sirC expression with transglutaminase-like and TPR domain
MEKKEILAMISLLDDNDFEVVSSVTDNLLLQGSDIIPDLEKAWEGSPNEKVQTRLETLIQDIQFNQVKDELSAWIKNGAEYILEGAFYVAKFQFPEISFAKLNDQIESMRRDIWLEINQNLTALEKVKIINYIIFNINKFQRNQTDFYSLQNSFINQVIESKQGNPISLSIVYLSVAWKLGLPIYGVNLPKNFILAYKDEYRHHDSADESEDILFYINPYNSGTVLGRREIDHFISQQKLTPLPAFYTPCTNRDIVTRLINNLIVSYEKLGKHEKITRMKELLRVVEP